MVPEVSAIYKSGKSYVRVECLSKPENVTGAHAYAALVLLTRAYSQKFETEHSLLPKNTAYRHFLARQMYVSRQQARMQQHIGSGSQYWFVPDSAKHEEGWLGLAETSPLRSSLLQKMKISKPDCYINDLVVDPRVEGSDISKFLLNTALVRGGYEPYKALVLGAFKADTRTNEWYEKLGMHVQDGFQGAMTIGDHSLDQVRYTTGGGHTIESVISNLAVEV